MRPGPSPEKRGKLDSMKSISQTELAKFINFSEQKREDRQTLAYKMLHTNSETKDDRVLVKLKFGSNEHIKKMRLTGS